MDLGIWGNSREVTRDQRGATDFRLRYSLRAGSDAYGNAEAIVFSRSAAMPLQAAAGRLPARDSETPAVTVDRARAFATCFKPADDGHGCILRLRETGGKAGPTSPDDLRPSPSHIRKRLRFVDSPI